jgi:predicted small integral membrane protein
MLTINCKIVLIAIVAFFFTLVAFNNMTDHETSLVFVQHVLSMDTVFPDSGTTWRAITSPALHAVFYWTIVAWETLTAILCWFAVAKLIPARKDVLLFKQRKSYAVLGLTSGFSLYALVFIAVGTEWFQMWQSSTWNSQTTAGLFMTMIGLTMLIVLAADE